MTKTRIQLRGICPVCGKSFATKNGRMVAHGYTLAHGFQSGECHGTNKPHYGHDDAVPFMQSYKATLEDMAIKTKELAKSANITAKQKRDYERSLNGLEFMTELLAQRIMKWKPMPLMEIDVIAEDMELRHQREAAAEQKKAARAKQDEAKAAARAEREAKAAAKWAGICANNTHQIELDGELILEWQSSYNSRTELERDYSKRSGEYLASVFDDLQDRINASWRLVRRVRSLDTGKQLHKF